MCCWVRQRLQTRMSDTSWDENSRCKDWGSHRGRKPASLQGAFSCTFNCLNRKVEVSLRGKKDVCRSSTRSLNTAMHRGPHRTWKTLFLRNTKNLFFLNNLFLPNLLSKSRILTPTKITRCWISDPKQNELTTHDGRAVLGWLSFYAEAK